MSDDDGESLDNGMFQEPEDFRPPEKPATFAQHTLKNGLQLQLRLVGFNPLWGHLLWNAGRTISDYLEANNQALATGKTVLELGAGAGLPSLTAAILGADRVVLTDYPDIELVENLKYNVEHALTFRPEDADAAALLREKINVQGYLWGSDVQPLLSPLPDRLRQKRGFDTLILADLLFNHSEHTKLVKTVTATLAKTPEARALVFFTPYRPWLLDKDLAFFPLAESMGLKVEKLFEKVLDKVLFENDPGDELLRRTVFAYQLSWPSTSQRMTASTPQNTEP